MFYINGKVLGIFLCGEKILKYKERKNRKIENEIDVSRVQTTKMSVPFWILYESLCMKYEIIRHF